MELFSHTLRRGIYKIFNFLIPRLLWFRNNRNLTLPTHRISCISLMQNYIIYKKNLIIFSGHPVTFLVYKKQHSIVNKYVHLTSIIRSRGEFPRVTSFHLNSRNVCAINCELFIIHSQCFYINNFPAPSKNVSLWYGSMKVCNTCTPGDRTCVPVLLSFIHVNEFTKSWTPCRVTLYSYF